MYPNYPNQQPYPGMPPQQPGMGYAPQYPYQQQPAMPQYPGMPAMPNQMPQFPGQVPEMPQQQQFQHQQYGAPPPQNAYPGMQQPLQGGYPGMEQQQYGAPMGNFQQQPVQQMHYYGQQQQQPVFQMPRPTVMAAQPFDACNDASILRKAMKGFGTDEAAIINVLCRRPSYQRMEIAKAYKTAYGKDLIESIRKETSNNFQKLCLALLTPKIQYYCEELQAAMEGTGTDEDVLIEIMCGGLPNREVQQITAEFHRMYGQPLEDALKSETSHSFRRLLVSLSTGNRDESMRTDINAAMQDAQVLKEAGVGCFGTDESEFNRILCLRNYEQLKLISQEYQKLSGNTLEKDIKKEFSGDIEDGLVSVLRCAISRPLFFAKCIHKAVEGFGTDDRSLIRLIITRCEIDMLDIKEEYQRKYNESMRDAIKGDTSGHYKHALYVLIGETKS